MSLVLPVLKHNLRLTHDHSNHSSYARETIVRETRAIHEIATRRSDVIETTSTAVVKLVNTGQTLLRHGLESFAPGTTRVEALKDPGSIDDIAGDFLGSSTHIAGQLNKLGRSTVYKICRYLNDIQVPLEKCHEAIREWNERERETYSEWRSINLDSLDPTLCQPHLCLQGLVDDQLKLLVLLKVEFTGMTGATEGHKDLMDLFGRCAGAQSAVQRVVAQEQLEEDEARIEAETSALTEAIHRGVSLHRSTNVPLVRHLESIVGLKLCGIVLEFGRKIEGLKQKIENAIEVEGRLSQS